MKGKLNLHNSDCMPALEKMDDNQFDLAIVDPPYGILNKMGGNTSLSEDKWGGKKWDIKPTELYFSQLKRVSKNQVVFGANYFVEYLCSGNKWIVWDKMLYQDQSHVELLWTSFEGADRLYRYSKSKLQGFQNPHRFHPTEKPIDIYKYLLEMLAKEGNTILDTHLGSGSIAIACYDLGFDLTGYEIDKDYFEAMEKRIKQHTDQLAMI